MSEPTESGKIKIITRATYDDSSYTIEDDVIYFVLENLGTNAKKYMSLYVGNAKQTDIISIEELLANANPPLSPEDIHTEDDIPPTLLTAINKLYYWEDTNLGVYKGFIKNSNNEILPLYGTPIWESIES
jgi:hypothetical protein